MCTSVWTLLQGARLEVLHAKFPVHFGHEQHQPVQAQQQIMLSTTMNNMLTDTALTPRHTITGNASGPVGCLGMSAGGSGGGEAKSSGKSAGKAGKGGGSNGGSRRSCQSFRRRLQKAGRGPCLCALRVYQSVMLCSCRLPDTGPEDPKERVTWMLGKVVKATGAAKLMVVRLEAVKHQESN